MDIRHKRLIEDGDKLFGDRSGLMQLWQELAEQLYVERSDFTVTRNLGDDFASHLTTSYPLLARRTLGESIGSMLRPVNMDTTSPGVWFAMKLAQTEGEDNQAKAWLEWATGTMRRAMYDRVSQFTRATKEGDHDFAAFGQCVLSLELNRARDALLYRCWHIRDCAWAEDAEGKICAVHRVWKPTIRQAKQAFGNKNSDKVKSAPPERMHETVEFRHVVVTADDYQDGKPWRTPWVSVWLDKTNDHMIEEVGSYSPIYIIPRWRTIPQLQYSHSPAAIVALPDARLIQAMTLTILDAGEKFADPPLVGTEDVIKSAVQNYPGGMTWVDAEYDERLGPALRALYEPNAGQGLNTALELSALIREQIAKAFFLDSLSLPPSTVGDKMTATEVGERISEWLRRAMPIFEPVEHEYNGALCEATFDLLMRNGAFGSAEDMPQSLQGQDVVFKFESPLHQAADRKKGHKLLETVALLSNVATIDPSVAPIVEFKAAFRDALDGIGVPAKWKRGEAEVAEIEEAAAQAEAAAAALAAIGPAATAAKDLGSATKSFADANAVQPVPA